MNRDVIPWIKFWLSDLVDRRYYLFENIPCDIIDVYDQDKNFIGKINMGDLIQLTYGLNTVIGVLPNGGKEEWIKESDGSAAKIRSFIESQLNIKLL